MSQIARAVTIPDIHAEITVAAPVLDEARRVVATVAASETLLRPPSLPASDAALLAAVAARDASLVRRTQATIASAHAFACSQQGPVALGAALESLFEGSEQREGHLCIPLTAYAHLSNPRMISVAHVTCFRGWVLPPQHLWPHILMSEALAKAAYTIPPRVPGWIRRSFPDLVAPLRRIALRTQRHERALAQRGIVGSQLPPCMANIYYAMRAQQRLGHPDNFAFMLFAIRYGWGADEFVELLKDKPGFSERKTRYQVEHAKTRGYKPLGCDALRSSGLCPDDACPGPHPCRLYEQSNREVAVR